MDRGSVADGELARRAAGGDREAFGALVRRYLRPGLAVAWEYVERREDAEDVVQEAFYRCLRRLDRFDTARPFAPWFFTIVRNIGRNEVAARARRPRAELRERLAPAPTRTDPAERSELRGRLEAAVEELPPMQRACFRLCEVEGFKRKEVAQMLGSSDATVRVHLHRARATLRERLSILRDEAATS